MKNMERFVLGSFMYFMLFMVNKNANHCLLGVE
jgi:hypothetical protein